MRLNYKTIRKIKEAENWIDTTTAREIAKRLKELITQAKNGIILDSDEQIIWDIIKTEIESQPEKVLNKEINRLTNENNTLKETNRILREKVKQITAQII